MAVSRRPRPPAAAGAGSGNGGDGGPFALMELALDLATEQLVPLEVTWLRRRGDRVRQGQELAAVRCRHGKGPEVVRKLVAPRSGTLEEALSPALPLGGVEEAKGKEREDNAAAAGQTPASLALGKLSYCTHPCLRDDRMCAVCGEVAPDMGKALEGGTTRVFVKGGHHVSVSKTEAASMHRSMAKQLARARKLHLVLDIDLTLLHATIDPRAEALPPPPAGMEVHAFDVMAMGRPLRHWCCLRPGLRDFLQRAHGLYVLTIYTHGRRDYAHQVAQVLDPDKTLFGDRIVSRDDCPDLHGQKSLQRLFPGGIEMALILDDSPQVWQGEQSRHLLPVVPYKYYSEFEEVNRVEGLVRSSTFTVKANAFGDPKEDTQLQHTWRVLQAVHALYYGEQPPAAASAAAQADGEEDNDEAEDAKPKNVAGCLATVRGQCLAGTSIVFSGLLPRGMDPRRSDLGYMATALGATVTEGLVPGTTHVVAENPSTEKCYHARQRPGVHIVSKLWLQLCFWHCEHKPEADYQLPSRSKAVVAAAAPATAAKPAAAGATDGAAKDGKRKQQEQEQGNGEEAAAMDLGASSKRAKLLEGQEEDGPDKPAALEAAPSSSSLQTASTVSDHSDGGSGDVLNGDVGNGAVAMEEVGGEGEQEEMDSDLAQALADELL